jgi:hypothetical protein
MVYTLSFHYVGFQVEARGKTLNQIVSSSNKTTTHSRAEPILLFYVIVSTSIDERERQQGSGAQLLN